jgi:hypothetical protein
METQDDLKECAETPVGLQACLRERVALPNGTRQ